jgi:hypothetical protein
VGIAKQDNEQDADQESSQRRGGLDIELKLQNAASEPAGTTS